MSWTELPSFDDVRAWLQRRAKITAEIRVLELRIQMREAETGLRNPRNTAIRVLGDEESRDLPTLREALVDKRNELDDVEADIKLFDYQKDVFKTLSYRERV